MFKKIKLPVYLILISIVTSPLYAGDLDDGMGIDEDINDNLQLNTNIDFIKRNALAKSKRNKGDSGCGGAGNQTFGPGANLKGATIVNLSDNKGASSVCIKR